MLFLYLIIRTITLRETIFFVNKTDNQIRVEYTQAVRLGFTYYRYFGKFTNFKKKFRFQFDIFSVNSIPRIMR